MNTPEVEDVLALVHTVRNPHFAARLGAEGCLRVTDVLAECGHRLAGHLRAQCARLPVGPSSAGIRRTLDETTRRLTAPPPAADDADAAATRMRTTARLLQDLLHAVAEADKALAALEG